MFEGQPFWLAFAGFFVIAMLRANATYWIGRAARSGVGRRTAGAAEPVGERPQGRARLARAEHLVSRYGGPAVALSFLTVGVQTAINASAGALRMPLRRYLPAVTVGALIWATLYATIGAAVRDAWTSGATRALVPAVVAVALIAGATVIARRRRDPQRTPDAEQGPGEPRDSA